MFCAGKIVEHRTALERFLNWHAWDMILGVARSVLHFLRCLHIAWHDTKIRAPAYEMRPAVRTFWYQSCTAKRMESENCDALKW